MIIFTLAGYTSFLIKIQIFITNRDRFPFYKSNDDRWKNSVRHNLSINPHFRKGNKAPQGAGHLWIISTRDSEANLLAWEHVSVSNYKRNSSRYK